MIKTFEHNGQKLAYTSHGQSDEIAFIWAHGWGVDHQYFMPLSQSLSQVGQHYLVDFPGFGQSPRPQEDWRVEDYAEFMKNFAAQLPQKQKIWIGHSFGGRVGVMMAANYPESIDKMVMIAAAGLKQKMSLYRRVKSFITVRIFKFMKMFAKDEEALNKLRSKYGSADYKNAGAMRPIFMNTIARYLNEEAKKVTCPTKLYYGALDTEAKPDMGERFSKLIPNSDFEIFDGMDHYTILTKGQHKLAQRIKNFAGEKNA